MKRLSIPAVIVLVLSLIIAIGSVSFLSPCVHDDGSFGACHWAGQALCALGILLSLEGLAALIVKNHGIKAGLLLSALFTAVLGFLIPGTVIDLCRMATMRCRAVMQPAMRILCVLIAISALIGMILESKKVTHESR